MGECCKALQDRERSWNGRGIEDGSGMMKRRTGARILFGLVLPFAIQWIGSQSAGAQAASYPSRQIQIVVPFPAGGSADFFARTVANKISATTGQPTLIENKAGASGMIGARAVINSPPDGYTLLVSSVTSVTIPPAMSDPRAFDALKDLAPVTGIGMVPAVLVIKPSLGIKTFAELINHAKANPGKINLASS